MTLVVDVLRKVYKVVLKQSSTAATNFVIMKTLHSVDWHQLPRNCRSLCFLVGFPVYEHAYVLYNRALLSLHLSSPYADYMRVQYVANTINHVLSQIVINLIGNNYFAQHVSLRRSSLYVQSVHSCRLAGIYIHEGMATTEYLHN